MSSKKLAMRRWPVGKRAAFQDKIPFKVGCVSDASSLIFDNGEGGLCLCVEFAINQDRKGKKPAPFSKVEYKQYPVFVVCLGLNDYQVQCARSASLQLCSISLPENIEQLAPKWFFNCKDLSRIAFSACSPLKAIEAEDFSKCPLVDVTIPDTVENLCDRCFAEIKTLRHVGFGQSSSLRRIGPGAFSDCSLPEIHIPDSVEELCRRCFYNCRDLSRVTFGKSSSLKVIGEEAFTSANLDGIHIPDGVEILPKLCFEYCIKLSRITFGESSSLKQICPRAFYYARLVEVQLPESIQDLDKECFYMCHRLAHIGLGSVKCIGASAFWTIGDNASLIELQIPDSVEEIGQSAFSHHDRLTRISFGKSPSLKRIRSSAFCSCGLEEIMIPDSVERLARGCFSECRSLRRVVFGESPSLKKIGRGAFSECLIEEISIPDSVEKLAEKCFHGCSSLSRVNFGKASSLKYIGSEAFSGYFYSGQSTSCSLSEITIPDSVEELGDECFYKCETLSHVNFGESSQLRVIGRMCFSFCNLASFSIPANVTTIGGAAFAETPLGEGLSCDANNHFCLLGPLLLTQDRTICVSHIGSLTEVVVPDSVQEIQANCFYNCPRISSFSFGPSPTIKRIGPGAFSGCNERHCCQLKDIKIPDTVEEIGDRCFEHCEKIERITFGPSSSLKRLGKCAFHLFPTGPGGLVRGVVIPRNVVEIGGRCFGGRGLSSVTFAKPSSLKRIGHAAFHSALLTTIEFPDTLEHLGGDSLVNTHRLESISFGKSPSVKYLGKSAFACSGLPRITIPDSVEEIGDGCFSSMAHLREVVFGPSPSVKRFGPMTFGGFGNALVEIRIPDTIEEIGNECFQCASKLERVIFGKASSLKRIGDMAFGTELVGGGCPVKEMVFPDSLEDIGYRCFRSCSSLERVVFGRGSSLKRIGAQAFARTRLETVVIPDGVEVGEGAFDIEYFTFSQKPDAVECPDPPSSEDGREPSRRGCQVQ